MAQDTPGRRPAAPESGREVRGTARRPAAGRALGKTGRRAGLQRGWLASAWVVRASNKDGFVHDDLTCQRLHLQLRRLRGQPVPRRSVLQQVVRVLLHQCDCLLLQRLLLCLLLLRELRNTETIAWSV